MISNELKPILHCTMNKSKNDETAFPILYLWPLFFCRGTTFKFLSSSFIFLVFILFHTTRLHWCNQQSMPFNVRLDYFFLTLRMLFYLFVLMLSCWCCTIQWLIEVWVQSIAMQFGYENVEIAIITSHGIEWRSYNDNNDRGKVERYPKIQNRL